jgi:hypothetical protein
MCYMHIIFHVPSFSSFSFLRSVYVYFPLASAYLSYISSCLAIFAWLWVLLWYPSAADVALFPLNGYNNSLTASVSYIWQIPYSFPLPDDDDFIIFSRFRNPPWRTLHSDPHIDNDFSSCLLFPFLCLLLLPSFFLDSFFLLVSCLVLAPVKNKLFATTTRGPRN